MEQYLPTREETLELLKKYNKSDSLVKHALAVEGVMKYFASLYAEDVDKWSVIGLIHDLDYEQFPEQHCRMTEKLLRENNWPEEYIYSVISHGWGICSDAEPIHFMEKVLFTIDELTGLIAATALMRPSKSILDMQLNSIKKKWKTKSFAAGVDRALVEKGAEMMGMELDKVMTLTLEGMCTVAEEIGLKGSL
ncbi:MAG: hydrolase [Clostridia bacterium]|nr:hydrolase [Clostridia bacterium]MBN2883711.1 hydrolase [Clostridia bacterium]